jgi:hypothetical protein
MTTITKSGSKLTVGAMNYRGKSIAKKIFELKSHGGERVRVHIGFDNKLTIESRPTQKEIICELDLPQREYEHTEKIVDGETVVESKEKELKLDEIAVKEYLGEVI